MSLRERFAKNTIANYLIQFWDWIIAFFLLPFIVQNLGASAAGIWLLATSLTSYFGLLDLGIGSSLIKHVAEYQTQEQEGKLNRSISTAFFIFSAMGLVAFGGLFMVGYGFMNFFHIPSELMQETRFVFYIAAATMGFGLPMKAFPAILKGMQRYDTVALVRFVASLFRVAGIVYFLSQGYGVIALTLINSLSNVLAWVLHTYFAKKHLPCLSIAVSSFSKGLLGTLFGLAVSLFVINVCMTIMYPTDRIVIGRLLGVAKIPFYEAASRLYQLVMRIPQISALAVIPTASALDASHNSRVLRTLFVRGTKYTMAFLIALAIPVLLLSKQILAFWMGEEFGSYFLLANIFILHLFFNFNHIFAYYLLVGMNRIRFALWYYVGSAVLNLILTIILVQRVGLIGAALGTTISYITFEPIFLWYILRTFRLEIKTYLREVLGKVYPQAVVIAFSLSLVMKYHPPRNLTEVGFLVSLGAGAYLGLFYLFGIEDSEKKSLLTTGVSIVADLRHALTNLGGE